MASKMMFTMAAITCLILLIWVGLRLSVGGVCPQPMTVADFDLNQYYGRWYEFAREENLYETGDCVTAEYYKLPKNYVSVNNI